MTGEAIKDPWRLAWMITTRAIRKIPRPGWGVCVSLVEDAAMAAFRGALQQMAAAGKAGIWKAAHDAALAAAGENILAQRRGRDPEIVATWGAWRG